MDVKTKFILNCLNDGWSVYKTDNNILKFTKNKEKMTPEEKLLISSDGFSEKFLQTIVRK